MQQESENGTLSTDLHKTAKLDETYLNHARIFTCLIQTCTREIKAKAF